jgi:hypothetical protein
MINALICLTMSVLAGPGAWAGRPTSHGLAWFLGGLGGLAAGVAVITLLWQPGWLKDAALEGRKHEPIKRGAQHGVQPE